MANLENTLGERDATKDCLVCEIREGSPTKCCWVNDSRPTGVRTAEAHGMLSAAMRHAQILAQFTRDSIQRVSRPASMLSGADLLRAVGTLARDLESFATVVEQFGSEP